MRRVAPRPSRTYNGKFECCESARKKSEIDVGSLRSAMCRLPGADQSIDRGSPKSSHHLATPDDGQEELVTGNCVINCNYPPGYPGQILTHLDVSIAPRNHNKITQLAATTGYNMRKDRITFPIYIVLTTLL